jgi:hypothetical protein
MWLIVACTLKKIEMSLENFIPRLQLLSGCGKDFSFYNSDFYSVSDLLQQVRP